MFCMNCGQQLPDGAKFCLNCGTPQGAVSPTGTTQSETINLDGMHTFVPAMCPNCNAHMKVDTTSNVARCDTCGTECLVQDAIKALTIKGNVQVENATINVTGTNTDSLLQRVEILLADGDFSGAMSKCDIILDSDPTNGKVYFYMLMSDLQCKKRDELTAQIGLLDGNQYYLKAMQYGDPELKNELQGYINIIHDRLKNAKVGDEIYFGISNGQKLWWRIIKLQDGKALVLSKCIVCKMPYNQFRNCVTWEKCTLRNWLNSDFIEGTFTQAERAIIQTSELTNGSNPEYKTPGGVTTTDKVFLLSIYEAWKYDQERAIGSCWWLRSPGNNQDNAVYVFENGQINSYGTNITDYEVGVRPAMWIQLD